VALDIGASFTRNPVGIICGQNNVAAAGNAELFSLQAAQNTLNTYDLPVVLSPSWAFILVGGNNINVRASFAWREVPLAQGEVGPF
jgi:hypothetical protein